MRTENSDDNNMYRPTFKVGPEVASALIAGMIIGFGLCHLILNAF